MLVNDLPDISRIESGLVELVKQAIDIRKVLQAVADTIPGSATQQAKPMQVVTLVPQGLPLVPGDRERVRQMILAVAENAFNYSEPNQTIRLEAKLEADGLQVDVSDTGIGISPEELKRLFDRFYRGEHPLVLKTPGNGLGLAIARQLAELHGGKLWLVASQVGQGSTFAIWLLLVWPGAETCPGGSCFCLGQESEVKMGLAAGAAEYVIKPFEPNMIILEAAELVANEPQPR